MNANHIKDEIGTVIEQHFPNGSLTSEICLDCGASTSRHEVSCPNHPAASFWGKKDPTSMGRALRLATIQNVFDNSHITEEEARELLSGPLQPGNEATVHDDSNCLRVEIS